MHTNIDKARIAILAPVAHPLPPPGYGPWEQVAFNVADGLRRRGVDVTLFCTANSAFEGARRSILPLSFSEDPHLNADVFTELHIANCFAHADEFDLIHSHLDWRALCFALPTSEPPLLTTIHGFSSPQILAAYYAASGRSFYCSISQADRDPGLSYLSTVYNGIDPGKFEYQAHPDDYLLFFGRFHEEKGAHVAIEVAQRARRTLVMAGIVHDERYYRERIAPYVDGTRVRFLGEVRGADRSKLLGRAAALLQMNTRAERFGLSMIEAMACGTPVIGANTGSIPEVVAHGETGFVCDDVDAAVRSVGELGSISRAACRERVERRFTIDTMVDGYMAAYGTALRSHVPAPATARELAARAADWWHHPISFTDVTARPASLTDAARLIAGAFAD